MRYIIPLQIYKLCGVGMDRRKRYRQTVALMSMLSETKTIDNVDIATFDGNGENLLSLIVGIDPVQDLHGYDSPWPAGGGVNKIVPQDITITTRGVSIVASSISETIKLSGTATGNGGRTSRLTELTTLQAGTYYFTSWGNTVGVALNDSDNAVVAWSGSSFTLESETNVYVGVNMVLGTTYTDTIKVALVSGSTAPAAWTPYSNICPISGWTECNISHSGADTSDPTIYTIAFPSEAGTVYGGTLDVVRKKLTVNRENIPSYNGETLSGEWISDRDVYSVGGTPTIGAQVVYALATPIVYDLADAPVIQTYEGENNIWADTGKIIFLEYEA